MRSVFAVGWLLAGCGRIAFDRVGSGEEDALENDMLVIPDLVAHYPFDEASFSGGVACATNNTLDGACDVNGGCPTSIAGVRNTAARFGGSTIVTLPTTTLVGSAPYTVAAWIDIPANLPQNGTIVSKPVAGAAQDTFNLVVGMPRGDLIFETTNATAPFDYVMSTPGIDLRGTGWHHVAASWDGTTKRIYIDGAEVGSAVTVVTDVPHAIIIGTDHDNNTPVYSLVGTVDDVRFYARALAFGELGLLATR